MRNSLQDLAAVGRAAVLELEGPGRARLPVEVPEVVELVLGLADLDPVELVERDGGAGLSDPELDLLPELDPALRDAVDDLENAVRVAVVSSESPALLRDSADIVLGSTTEFLELLRRL